jgi:hypothetical protein
VFREGHSGSLFKRNSKSSRSYAGVDAASSL